MDQIEQAYRVLELELGTSMTEVNQSYKDLVFIWHPDRIPADRERLREKAEAKLKVLNEARSFLRSQCRNGKIPASTTIKTASASQSRARSSDSTYRPGDDSTYRPYSRNRSAYQSASASNGRAGGYRPPYEAYRRAASYSSSAYGDGYRPYASSRWPRQSAGDQATGGGQSNGKTPSSKADGPTDSQKVEAKTSDPTNGQTSSQTSSQTNGQSDRQASSQNSTPTSSRSTPAKAASSPPASSQSASSPPPSSQPTPQTNSAFPYYTQPARAKRDPDLSGADLRGANLKEKDFSGRNLSGADLAGADLSDTFMHRVNLNRANLRKARLFRANLLQADLSHADLSGADLIGADLSGADLSGADLSGAKVGYGDKIMVKLLGARLTGTIMPNGRIHE